MALGRARKLSRLQRRAGRAQAAPKRGAGVERRQNHGGGSVKQPTVLEQLAIGELRPNPNNARTHSKHQLEQLQRSLREFGAVAPILVDSENNVIAGHGRLMAAQAEGWQEFPCVRVEHLTPEQLRAYALADNRLAEMADWDMALVSAELTALEEAGFDISLTGFRRDDVAFGSSSDVEEDDFDGAAESSGSIGRSGTVWELGAHLLVCGDGTSVECVNRLLGGERAACVVTDPPYNMNYVGAGRGKRGPILNDNMPDDAFAAFLTAAYAAAADALVDGGALYAFYKELGSGVFVTALTAAGLTFRQELVWVKNQPVLGGAKYQNMYEPLVFATKGNSYAVWNGGRRERSAMERVDLMNEEELRAALKALLDQEATDVLREPKPQKSDLHPTMKPVRLLARLIRNSTDEGDIVLDLFGGSGSTLMACEQMGRRCRMVELDPAFCDVIVRRWEAFTGRKAVRHEA